MCIGYFCIPFDEQLLLVVLGMAFAFSIVYFRKVVQETLKRIKENGNNL
jgi:hypothetical protein